MTRHASILRELYDYLRNDLPEEDRARVQKHLGQCPRCARALADLRATLGSLEPLRSSPASDPPESYWEQFLDATMSAVQADRPRGGRTGWWESIVALTNARRRWILAAGGTAVAVGLVLMLETRTGPAPDTMPPPLPASAAGTADGEVDAYLRRSQALLVSLTSTPPGGDQPGDLALERAASRELVDRGRAFDGADLDPRSARVVSDLNRVFLELANLEAPPPAPDLQIVLDGIRERNLLFRVRMASAVRDSVRHLRAAMMMHRE